MAQAMAELKAIDEHKGYPYRLILFATGIACGIFANLLSALVVGILSEIFAIVKKAPATGFIVIGVIPLVPGFRVYRSMLYFVRGALDKGLTEGVRACFMAIAIAVGIILATSITRIVRQHIKH